MTALPTRPMEGEKVFITQHAVDRCRERFAPCVELPYAKLVAFLVKAAYAGELVARSKTPGVVAVCYSYITADSSVDVVGVLKPTTPGQWYMTSVLTVPILREDSGFFAYPLLLNKYA